MQLAGPCGKQVADLKYWTTTYDSSKRNRRASRDGEVELELLVYCPCGQYGLVQEVKSYNEHDAKPDKDIGWRVEDGRDGVRATCPPRSELKLDGES